MRTTVQASWCRGDGETASPPSAPASPLELLKSRSYVGLLVLGAVVGIVVATASYFFLKGVAEAQEYLFTTLPADLGFDGAPVWWPLPLLALGGLVVGLTIRYLPGTGGHAPADGFKPSGAVPPVELPGIVIAAFATLSCGAVLGPEAPLIAIGSGMGVLAVHLVRRNAPQTASAVDRGRRQLRGDQHPPRLSAHRSLPAHGGVRARGAMLGVVLVPGLLAAGVGSLIFIGLNSWTGFGNFSLAVPDIPTFTTPDVAEFFWAVGIGIAAAVLGSGIRRLALLLQPVVERRMVLLTPVAGLAVAGLAIVFGEWSDESASQVLFSGPAAGAHRASGELASGSPGLRATPVRGACARRSARACCDLHAGCSARRGGPPFPTCTAARSPASDRSRACR